MELFSTVLKFNNTTNLFGNNKFFYWAVTVFTKVLDFWSFSTVITLPAEPTFLVAAGSEL